MLYPERDRDRGDTDSGDTARSRRHDTGVSQIEFRIPRSEAFFSQPATDPGTNDDDCTGIGCWFMVHKMMMIVPGSVAG